VSLRKETYFNAGDWLINSVISGAGSITYLFNLSTHAGRELFLTPPSPCSYTGGTTVDNPTGIDQRVRVYADGAFGTGDVTIRTGSRVDFSGTSDVIDDLAALYIEGTGKLNLGSSDEAVFKCYVDGVQQADGVYTSAESWLLGTGSLTVYGPPSGTVVTLK